MSDITVRGNDYEITVCETDGGWTSWAIQGHYKDSFIDSMWCDIAISSFEEADAMVLDLICEG